MSEPDPAEEPACADRVAVGVRAAYDAVATAYDAQLGFLAARHPDVVSVDQSPGMIAVAREHTPQAPFEVGSMLALPAVDGAWSGAVALYAIIHLGAEERAVAFREFARALRPGGWLLVSFHVDSHEFASGEVNHLTSWFGQAVEIDGYFLDPVDVVAQLEPGFTVVARADRQPFPDVEYPSRRCYCSPNVVQDHGRPLPARRPGDHAELVVSRPTAAATRSPASRVRSSA